MAPISTRVPPREINRYLLARKRARLPSLGPLWPQGPEGRIPPARMQWYEEVVQILLIGIANGAIIALVALGYTLVYGIIELINFAHGDVFMIGTMVSLTLVTWVPSLLGVRQAGLLPPLTLLGLIAGSLLASIVVCATLNV